MQDAKIPVEPRELELKLEIDLGDVDRFRKHRFFRSRRKPTQLRAIYFDTRKFALRENGISFRVRQEGSRHVQTIKAERQRSGVALDRAEWEHELDSTDPDFSKALETPLGHFVQDGASRKIKPVFTVHTERLIGHCGLDGAEIELALDNAWIETENRRAGFAEIELELKSGEPGGLYAAALDLASTAPVRLSVRTKSGRGYGLLAENRPACAKAEKIILQSGQETALAFQIIASSCLRQLIENETLLRENSNPDAVHQARVAIRRLRAAISIFRTVVADDQVKEINAELKAMADPLGEARDLDIFIAKVLKPARKGGGDDALPRMIADFRARRDVAYAKALETVASDKFGLSLLRVATWIETGPWLAASSQPASGLRKTPVETFAAGDLGSRWSKVRKRMKRIDEIDEESRHRLRIEIKKLRYASEFFSAPFASVNPKRLRAAQDVIEALQSTLGDLNDIAVARATAASHGSELLIRDRESAVPGLLAEAKDQAGQFRALQPFWTGSTES